MGFTFRTIVLFFLTIYTLGLSASPGHDTGSGGDAVLCQKSSENEFQGWYSLDYLVTYKKAEANRDVVEVASWKASFTRLRAQFASKLPELLESFDSFTANVENTRDHSRARLWEEAAFGLVELSDERLTVPIVALAPKNCLDQGKLRVVQAVIRQPTVFTGAKSGRIIYKYVPSVFKNLEENSPLQLSFLLVHEWLWDLSGNVDRNRRVNRFLHSDALEKMTREQLIEQLSGMGLVLPTHSPAAFRDDSCPADPDSLPTFFAKIPKTSRNYIAGRFHLYARRKSCDTKNGCSGKYLSWVDDFDRHFADIKYLDFSGFSPASFELRSLTRGGGKPYVHASCRVDARTAIVECSSLASMSGNRYQYQGNFRNSGGRHLVLRGTMSGECLRLSDSGLIRGMAGSNSPAWWFEDEVVLFSRYRMDAKP